MSKRPDGDAQALINRIIDMTKKVSSVVVADARGQPIPKFGEAPLSVLLSGDHQIHD